MHLLSMPVAPRLAALVPRPIIVLALAALSWLAVFGLVLLLASFAPAFAQDTVVAPDATTVVLPVGTWVDGIIANAIGIATAAVLALFAWGVRQLPKGVADIVKTLRIEQLLVRAVDYGLNAVAGATRGRTLDVRVGSEVLAQAAQYAIDQAPGRLIEWAGGVEAIKKMILARLQLAPEADAVTVLGAPAPAAVR